MGISLNRHHQQMQSLWNTKQQSIFHMSREKPGPQENRVINPAQTQNFWFSSRNLNIFIQVIPKSHPTSLAFLN